MDPLINDKTTNTLPELRPTQSGSLDAGGESGTVFLGREVMRIVPRWSRRFWLRRILPFSTLAAFSLALDVILPVPWLWTIGVYYGVIPLIFWIMKPQSMSFCDHGLALFYPMRRTALIPYSNIVYCHGGVVRTAKHAWQFGTDYVNDDEIDRCFRAVDLLASGHGRLRIDPWTYTLLAWGIVPPLLVIFFDKVIGA